MAKRPQKDDEKELYNNLKKGKEKMERRKNDTYINPKKKRFLDYCDREIERMNK